MAESAQYNLLFTSDIIDVNLCIRINQLEGPPPKGKYTLQQLLDNPLLRHSGQCITETLDYFVTCQLYANGEPFSLPVRTSQKSFTSQPRWMEWLTMPVKYAELAPNTQVALTVWDIAGPRKAVPIGGTTFNLFTSNGVMRRGRQKLYLWLDREADGSINTTTPGHLKARGELDRLENKMKKFERGDIQRLPWLDPLTFREIERINQQESKRSKDLFLAVEMQQFEFPVVCSPDEVIETTTSGPVVVFKDPDIMNENLVESLHRKLVRSHRRDVIDRNLKPTSEDRAKLNTIFSNPPMQHLTADEKDLLWKFRYSLMREKKALSKFLRCVDWSDKEEAKDAVQLLQGWVAIDVDDALELLGAEFRESMEVREYAVRTLEQAPDDVLLMFMLQLVQALRYEGERATSSSLARLLVKRAVNNSLLGNYFFWYLQVECEDKSFSKVAAECQERYRTALRVTPEGEERSQLLDAQIELITKLNHIVREMQQVKDRQKNIVRLREMLSPNGPAEYQDLVDFTPMPLPQDPGVLVHGIVGERCTIFKSQLNPLNLCFKTNKPDTDYFVMYKQGDDLRQDQLIIQLFSLMDSLLLKENLDLKLTPYRVLATSKSDGLVQVIPSTNLAKVLQDHRNDIQSYFRKEHPSQDAPYGIAPEVLDTFVRSCAGYCVITYLLAVGDRHLDNLLITSQGNMFHIDFGYILGHDPKPLPPPMKLCKEMVEAMGGTSSKHYEQFISHCCEAYNILRKSANLVLNLLSLMIDANIPNLSVDPQQCIKLVHENFRVDMTDEEAIVHFQKLVHESVTAVMPQMVEAIHRWAQYWRR